MVWLLQRERFLRDMTTAKKPNIVIINPDQMRWDYASCYGHPFINTKNLDRLAAMGTRFEYAFASCPMCAPSRTSFLTGQYAIEHGVRNYGGMFPQQRPNALRNLGEAGYVRGLWGKDHVFSGKVIGTLYDEGENVVSGVRAGHPAYQKAWDSAVLEIDSEWNTTKRLTDGGLNFIDRHAGGGNPFFLTINYQDPHPFFACPEPWASLFEPDQFSLPKNFRRAPTNGEIKRLTHWRIHTDEVNMPEHDLKRAMAMYSGQIRYVDYQIGRVLDKLETLGILDETIVLFWSDHGEFIGDFGVTHKMPAFFECLIRAPLVIWDPTGHVPKGVSTDLVQMMDAMATVLDLCEIPQPEGSHARSLLNTEFARDEIFADAGLLVQQPKAPIPGLRLKAAQPPTAFGPGAMLRTRDWKLTQYADDKGELYDLKDDPNEIENRYDDPSCAAIVQDMKSRLLRRMLCNGQAPEDLPEGVIKKG
jgi:arylsulfatase A-like enzyme